MENSGKIRKKIVNCDDNFLTKFEKWTNLDKFENIFFIASNEQWKNLI